MKPEKDHCGAVSHAAWSGFVVGQDEVILHPEPLERAYKVNRSPDPQILNNTYAAGDQKLATVAWINKAWHPECQKIKTLIYSLPRIK